MAYDNPTPRQQLYDLHKALRERAFDLMRKKNADYAAGDDPYRNFRQFGLMGILVRLGDKLARLQSFVENGQKFHVQDEGLKDTLIDVVNYAILFGGLAGLKAEDLIVPEQAPIKLAN